MASNTLNDESWIAEFYQQLSSGIHVSDNLFIEFDRTQSDKSCLIFVQNHTSQHQRLMSVHIDLPTVKLREELPIQIESKSDIILNVDAAYIPNKFCSVAKVSFNFENSKIVRRSIRITYRQKGPVIPRSDYDAPIEFIELMSDHQMHHDQLVAILDCQISTMHDNYAHFFHSLLYLEEVGQLQDFKNKYSQTRAVFNDTDRRRENGRDIRTKYPRGIYDLQVSELFETRPSLKIGDKVIARAHSTLTKYEGIIIKMKDDDLLIIQFGDDFVNTFNHLDYFVDFSVSRSTIIRQHFAIDLAVELFGIEFLMPNGVSLREKNRTNVHMNRWFNGNLNYHQQKAVKQVLRGNLLNPYIIVGPPGTGKTTTLQEIVLQIATIFMDSKILIITQSNSAANLITERLVQENWEDSLNLIRLISFNYKNRQDRQNAAHHMIPSAIRDYCKGIDDLEPDREMRFIERLELIKKFRVVIGTSSTIAQLLEGHNLRNHFTHAIIDEAGQCTEIDVLVPMVLVGKVGQIIMAGDPNQMPPLVINKHANDRGLSISMLSRLIECYAEFDEDNGLCLISKLVNNYRSLPSILDYCNTLFYKSELIPMIHERDSDEARILKHMVGIFPDIENAGDYGIHFVNVEDGHNQKKETSWFNIEEVQVMRQIVVSLLGKLKAFGLNGEEIGIITPYAMQSRALKKCFESISDDIRIGTVEDFQGLERQIILISTVRTCQAAAIIDTTRRLGFVKCPKRINVAMSRARAMVIVVGKAELLSRDMHWKNLIEGCKQQNTYRTMNGRKPY
ncbi:probable RNA helicase armi [Contarinia nasturtii]|uniref:probable RNA helicase armi n=1 Tax=Contarinia nasturtii TaxID=265458 RepID=UPI0012D4AF98|nr:probable RNA helicase armi [Contarinia nasturtii]